MIFSFSSMVENIKHIYYVIAFYAFISLLFWGYAYYIKDFNFPYIHPLWDKGLYDMMAPQGFSSTPQVLGTFCCTGVLIFLMEEKERNVNFVDYFLLSIIVVCIVITYNRASQIVLLALMCLRFYKIVLPLSVLLLIFLFLVDDRLYNALFTDRTLTSRIKFLDGFIYSFFSIGTIDGQLFGNGTFLLDNFIVYRTNSLREYVENLYAGLLFAYGIVGFWIYNIISFLFIVFLFRVDRYLVLFMLLYLFLVPQFTHELLSTSFYFCISVVVYYASNFFYISKTIKHK
jgi:hypothetical protein